MLDDAAPRGGENPKFLVYPASLLGGVMYEWRKLLSNRRLAFDAMSEQYKFLSERKEEHRSDYYRDSDRVLFSSAFRRMHDKTQVFPMPENDHVHSRLTHSIEVASVGRSLGHTVGSILAERDNAIRSKFPRFAADIGDVIHAACLAHDIGNPPFGHAGEDAIAKYFVSFFERNPLLASELTRRQKSDLTKFEGNAQGFRLLTRLQNADTGGLQLTAATLAAFCKYPRESGDDIKICQHDNIAAKKHGCFQEDKSALAMIARHVGLNRIKLPKEVDADIVHARHPLSFLVEAADNISYTILDLEDGIRLKYVNKKEALELIRKIAKKANGFDPKKANDIVHLRGRAIQRLRTEVCEVFLDKETFPEIMEGTYKKEIIKVIESNTELEKIIEFTKQHCYQHQFVVEMQVAGYNIIAGLLDELIPAVIAHSNERTHRQKMVLKASGIVVRDSETAYQKILKATDYVAGMADSFASALFRRLKGIELSSSIR
ncbi:MAG: dNTP triphosphohydrolase [Myxococcales bacterium]|nr:dNTP triphosphohydrolase [Myxococcales bacterium]